MASQTYTESKERFRDGDGDGEEDEDGEETLDPRVKASLHFVLVTDRIMTVCGTP